jgi:hypothetical protein
MRTLSMLTAQICRRSKVVKYMHVNSAWSRTKDHECDRTLTQKPTRQFYGHKGVSAAETDMKLGVMKTFVCLLQTSYQQVMKMKPACLRRRIMVSFVEEEGMDAGGLTRFWSSKYFMW